MRCACSCPEILFMRIGEQTYPDRQRRLMRPLTIMADGDADIPGSTRHGNNTQALELFCRPFAERFKVSTTHMMHRLLGLGLNLT